MQCSVHLGTAIKKLKKGEHKSGIYFKKLFYFLSLGLRIEKSGKKVDICITFQICEIVSNLLISRSKNFTIKSYFKVKVKFEGD